MANRFSTGKGIINRIKRSRNNLDDLEDVEGNLLAYLKKRKNCVIKPGYELIENSVVRFLTAARERRMPVTGLMLKSLAERQARKSGINGFTACEGWLGKVKARHGISGRKLSGEAGSVNKVVIKNWKEELPGIIAGYDMKDIFNCDETASSFFEQPTTKSLIIHGDHGHGNKRDKSRVSLLLCTSWLGEKILLIGASQNPRALKGTDKSKLPVIYRAQKKSWMPGIVFVSWIKDFDTRMTNSKRRVYWTPYIGHRISTKVLLMCKF